ncbi:unnamed protein product [Moneuplotes crassus]|uniref:Uncharacterized protein n=1 Tax=Euplotes crassus TaxID=5936 RepID=A0AAD1XIY1_EUPCR|nr:unnamed protein product [Moneuplotes crassus]
MSSSSLVFNIFCYLVFPNILNDCSKNIDFEGINKQATMHWMDDYWEWKSHKSIKINSRNLFSWKRNRPGRGLVLIRDVDNLRELQTKHASVCSRRCPCSMLTDPLTNCTGMMKSKANTKPLELVEQAMFLRSKRANL